MDEMHYMDEMNYRQTGQFYNSDYESFSKSTFLNNRIHRRKSVSNFSVDRGQTANICDLPRASLSSDLGQVHIEQASRRDLDKLLRAKHWIPIAHDLFRPNIPMCFFKKEVKGGAWHKTNVLFSEPNIVQVCADERNK